MKRVVVTGANGYIGSHVVIELLRHKDVFSVVASDLEEQSMTPCEFIGFDILKDATDDSIYERCGKPDICIHLAWRNGFQHNASLHILDLPHHFAFLKNLADHGTKQFAVAGSFREYGKVNGMVDEKAIVIPDNFYSLAKITLKRALEICFFEKEICLQWLRPFTVYGDDEKNQSILSKIIKWEKEGKETFPFTDGNEMYDYILVEDLARQIAAIISQTDICGVIDCCSGIPVRLGDKIEEFLTEKGFKIRPEYGVFLNREYDSNVIYGDRRKIEKILKKCELYQDE